LDGQCLSPGLPDRANLSGIASPERLFIRVLRVRRGISLTLPHALKGLMAGELAAATSSLAGLFVTLILLPQTKSRSLEDIERDTGRV
jgi:hypothetical protein